MPAQSATTASHNPSTQEERADRRPERLALAALLLLAGVLRFWHLGARSLWVDEGSSYAIARLDWWNFARLLWRREANMSFYYLLLRPLAYFAHSEAVLRSLAAIAGVLAIPAIYLLGRSLFGRSAGLLAALLLALNAYHVRYSQEARGYSLAVLLLICSGYFLVQLLAAPGQRTRAAYATTGTLAVYSHFYAALALVAQWSVLPFVGIPAERKTEVGRAVRIICAAVIPLAIFVAATGAGPLAWLPKPGWKQIYEWAIFMSGGTRLLLAAYAAGLLLAAIASVQKDEAESWKYLFVLAWLFLPATLTLGLSFFRPLFLPRFLIVSLPALCLLTAAGISRVRPAALGAVVGLVLIVASWDGVRRFQSYGLDEPLEEWRMASGYLLAQSRAGDAAVFYSSQGRMPYEFYRSQQPWRNGPEVVFPSHGAQLTFQDFMGRPEGSMLAGLAPRYPRVWLVMCHDLLPTGYDAPTQNIRGLLSAHYSLAAQVEFPGVQIELYQLPREKP